jgi:D-alanine-D-alanine ligase
MSLPASSFGKVALLMGGWSAEREISLKSGRAVLAALEQSGVDVHAIDVGRDVMQQLQKGNYDRAFNMLHGRGGEDGVIQGALELIGMPYTGSGVMGSALSMDKLMTKRLWLGAGQPTPGHLVLKQNTDINSVVAELGLPLIIKPASEGSSIGMSKVDVVEELQSAYEEAARFDCPVFAEQWITGEEYTVAILDGEALPVIRLKTPQAFYNYEAKYQSTDTQYLCPCGLDDKQENSLKALALEAFETSGATGWGRVDLMVDASAKPWLIELNTVPGMTDHSLVPMAARAAGMSFEELVMRILATSMEYERA